MLPDISLYAETNRGLRLINESGYPEIYREKGYIAQRKGQRSEAVLLFKKYLTLSPNAVDREAVGKEVKNLGGVLE